MPPLLNGSRAWLRAISATASRNSPTAMPSIANAGERAIDDDRLIVGVFRHEHDVAPAAPESLDRHVVAKARDHDLAVARLGTLAHGEQVAVVDARVFHAVAAHAQKVIGARLNSAGSTR